MDQKQAILHELLQQHQEPFHLKTYISDKRSQRSSPAPESSAPRTSGFLHVPTGTATVLIEAATRIQKQRQPSTKTQIRNVGRSLFGSFLKILKHRSKVERENLEEIRISCRLCRDDHFREAFHDSEARFGSSPRQISPFRFSPLKSPTSFSGRRTPDLCSPATSPVRRVKQEEENVNGVEEEKEQCSPVSVLDSLYEEEDEDEEEEDQRQSLVGEEDDYDVERSYANIERARQNLIERLERFEKLAALDEVGLEQKLLEASEEVEFEQCSKQGLWSRSSPKESRTKMNKIVRCCQDAIDDVMVEVELHFKTEVEETAIQMELTIFEELMEQCFCI